MLGKIRDIWDLLGGGPMAPTHLYGHFAEPDGIEKPFAPHYQEHIHPHILRFEEKRVHALKVMRSRLTLAIPVGAVAVIAGIVLVLLAGFTEATVKSTLFVETMILAGLGWWVYKPEVDYKSDVKSSIFPNIFSYFGEDYRFTAQVPFKMNLMEPSGIVPRYSSEKLEDYVKGSYQDVKLEMFEAHLEVQGNKRSHTTFKGFCLLLSMNKNFKGKTIVKKDMGAVGNFISNGIRSAFDGLSGGNIVGSMDNVRLEDPTFEKLFEVYSNDQVQARYLLTTSFMERLTKLANLYGGGVQCSFYNNKLFLMIPSYKNMFEATSIFQPATFHDDIATILEEMPMIFQIVDVLKLDERTGL